MTCNESVIDMFDIFYLQPAMGLVSSPQDFGRGLAKGTTSLLKHTVTGLFGAASKVTGKIAEGIAVLGMDEEFQRRARMDARKPPRHLGEGLVEGGKSVVMGVYRGLTGIVTDPYHGYRLQGVRGLFKGIGTGVLGIALKPTAGTISAASKVLQGVGNTATCCDEVYENDRARCPRYIGSDRILRPYNAMDAVMAANLRLYKIKDLAFSKEDKEAEIYITSFQPTQGNLIVSDLRLLMLPSSTSGFKGLFVRKRPKAIFSVLWEDVKGFTYIANTVIIQNKRKEPLQLKVATEAEAKDLCSEVCIPSRLVLNLN
jgi:hypothetical protein